MSTLERVGDIEARELLRLDGDWWAAACPPDAHSNPTELDGLDWLPARVPGTAAAAMHAAGRWRPGEHSDFDQQDWWFRTEFHCPSAEREELVVLELDGLATVAEVFFNGEKLLESDTMFAARSVEVGDLLREHNELAIRCRALAQLLSPPRKPRARWRTRLVDGNLRFARTMLLGRAPGFAADPAAVGPWRPIRLVRWRTLVVEQLRLRTSLRDGEDREGLPIGELSVELHLRALEGTLIENAHLQLHRGSSTHVAALELHSKHDRVLVAGALTVSEPELWWPHTHGEPALYKATVRLTTTQGPLTLDAGTVGFRTLSAGARSDHQIERDGLDLHVNGVRVFARGAVWTPPDPVGLAPSDRQLRTTLKRARDAGMNMLRVPGTSVYESREFHDLCDELGLLVWQDFMFANLDYPIADERFRATVEQEASEQLAALAGRPSLAVLCGNSEIEQQVAMLGLDPALGRGELFGQLLPRLIEQADLDAVYVPSAPCGGTLPFRTDRGIANYYGVGGYRRPLEDVRRANVRFAAECLAFSNVPCESAVEAVLPDDPGEVVVHHPAWKAGVPRDAGSGWDFEDVRDHYLKQLFGVDPATLRSYEHERYLELSRAVSGEAMAEVFAEWRSPRSGCGGGLVLWLSDLAPGAGWGVLDHAGHPKPAYYHLKRAFQPIAVWMIDEGLGGIRVHVANDSPTALLARLRVALYRDGEQLLEQAHEQLELPPHGGCEHDLEQLLGHFLDASWAYRFGPAAHDTVVASLERPTADGSMEVLSQAFRFPVGRPLARLSPERLGLEGILRAHADGTPSLTLRSARLAYGVRIHVPGLLPTEDALTLEPGIERRVLLAFDGQDECSVTGALTALNLHGSIQIVTPERS